MFKARDQKNEKLGKARQDVNLMIYFRGCFKILKANSENTVLNSISRKPRGSEAPFHNGDLNRSMN